MRVRPWKDGGEKSLALCSTLDAVPSIYYWQNRNQEQVHSGPCQMFAPSRLNEVLSFVSVYPCYILSEHIDGDVREIRPYSICFLYSKKKLKWMRHI